MSLRNKIASFFNALFVNSHHFGIAGKIERVVAKMNLTEKILFIVAASVTTITGIVMVVQVHNSFLVEVPRFGGSFTEGVIGSPRFVNPVLAISDTDKDLTALIYSGLLKNSADGGVVPDLASSYDISDDGTVIDVKINDRAYFHDGKKVTADDVIFTINEVMDPVIKSPKRTNWEGVTVEKISDAEVKFILKKPYSPFLNSLTLGILPKHLWQNVSSEEFPFSGLNIDPVGAGPYQVKKVARNSGSIPTSITLSSWSKYAEGRPIIKEIVFKFFQNETELAKAYGDGSIESAAGISPSLAKKLVLNKNQVDQVSLPRVFGVFFNQNVAPVFLNKEVREALDATAPKKRIVDEVLFGFGKVLNGPTPANVDDAPQTDEAAQIEAGKASLSKAGWTPNADGILEKKTKSGTSVLSFSIYTSDAPELKKTAEILKETWEKLGAKVEIKIFEAGDLSQNVIKSRKYDALLFGEVVSNDSDLYPFWHSSERNDPGLNVALYTNITVDKKLADLQTQTDPTARETDHKVVFEEISKDIPAVFLFSPNFLYAPAPEVKNISLKDTSSPSERFLSINKWYIETDKVLKFFRNQN